MAVNVLGTWHVLLAAEAAGAGRVIVFSSAQVFGIAEGERLPGYFPVDDAHPRRAARPYGLSKRLAEDLCEGSPRGPGSQRCACARWRSGTRRSTPGSRTGGGRRRYRRDRAQPRPRRPARPRSPGHRPGPLPRRPLGRPHRLLNRRRYARLAARLPMDPARHKHALPAITLPAADPDVHPEAPLHKDTVGLLVLGNNQGRPSGQLRECVGRKRARTRRYVRERLLGARPGVASRSGRSVRCTAWLAGARSLARPVAARSRTGGSITGARASGADPLAATRIARVAGSGAVGLLHGWIFISSTAAARAAAVPGVIPNLPGSGTATEPCMTPASAGSHLMPA